MGGHGRREVVGGFWGRGVMAISWLLWGPKRELVSEVDLGGFEVGRYWDEWIGV